jgi:hypothetical protein
MSVEETVHYRGNTTSSLIRESYDSGVDFHDIPSTKRLFRRLLTAILYRPTAFHCNLFSCQYHCSAMDTYNHPFGLWCSSSLYGTGRYFLLGAGAKIDVQRSCFSISAPKRDFICC